MIGRAWVAAVLWVAGGCSGGVPDPGSDAPPDRFVGSWRSVTPSLEFVGLSVVSKSSEMGALAARLTLSGLALEGTGRIEGDSLVVDLAAEGTTVACCGLVAHARDAGSLEVRFRPESAPAIDVRFVRQD